LRRLPTFLHGDEIAPLLGAAKQSRDRLLAELALCSGLRVSELSKLEVPDLDLDGASCFVRGGKGDKDRVIPLATKLIEPLRVFLAGRKTGPVFCSRKGASHLRPRAIQRIIKDMAKRAGVARRVSPHTCRHTAATRMLELGASLREVQIILGHSSVRTTEIYTHVSTRRLRAAVDLL
jgi:site-specific recombinase XerD